MIDLEVMRKKLTRIFIQSIVQFLFKIGFRKVTRKILTRNLKLHKDLPKSFVFKLAESIDEFEQAFNILYENYVDEGFMLTNESKLRITAYHLLPTSMTLICKDGTQVVATISIIKNNKFGMPTSEIINANELINSSQEIGEIGSLAIKKSYQSRSGRILFPFCKFILNYCKDYLKLDYAVISHHPRWLIFYNLLFGFKRITPKTIDSYNFANGAPVDLQLIDFNNIVDLQCSQFYNYPVRSNVWTYVWKKEISNFKFPLRNFFITADNILGPELIKYFFVQKTNVFFNLPSNQKEIIKNLYRSKRFDEIFKDEGHISIKRKNKLIKVEDFNKSRRNNRISVSLKTIVTINENLFITGKILNASIFGFQIKIDHPLQIDEKLLLRIQINEFNVISLNARIRRNIKEDTYGAVITGEATGWYKEISSILKQYEDLNIQVAV